MTLSENVWLYILCIAYRRNHTCTLILIQNRGAFLFTENNAVLALFKKCRFLLPEQGSDIHLENGVKYRIAGGCVFFCTHFDLFAPRSYLMHKNAENMYF